jgi:hypothetical protein
LIEIVRNFSRQIKVPLLFRESEVLGLLSRPVALKNKEVGQFDMTP